MLKCKAIWALQVLHGVISLSTTTKKGISVERILFDGAYWADLKQKLQTFYFAHFIKTASSEFAKNSSRNM